jgi:hypothetical protein
MRVRKQRTISQALSNGQWIRDISGALSVQALQQYVQLWERASDVVLSLNPPDKFI